MKQFDTDKYEHGFIDVYEPYFNNSNTGGSSVEILGGLYNLKLPADQFTKLGIYTLMIRPA